MRSSTRHFVRHYAEMIAAMFLGMLVLGMPAAAGLGAATGKSTSALNADLPSVMLLGMAVSMTVPMVAWMRRRGHGWAPCVEMSAAMFVPTFGVIALLAAGALTDFHTLMLLEHVVMLPAMLVAMLWRRDEYTGGSAHHDMCEPQVAT